MSVIVQHLRSGQDRQQRVIDAVEAFRRLAPADHPHFLAMIEPLLAQTLEPALQLTSGDPERTRDAQTLVDATKRVVGKVADAASAAEPTCKIPDPNSRGRRPRDWLREPILIVLGDGRARRLSALQADVSAMISIKVDISSMHGQLARMIENGLVMSEGARMERRYSLSPSVASARASAKPAPPSEDPDPEPVPAPPHPAPAQVHPPRSQAVKLAPAPPGAPAKPVRRPEYSRVPDRDVPPVDIQAIYVREARGVKLLTTDDEIRLAQELHALETELWRLLWAERKEDARARFRELDDRTTKGKPITSSGAARKLDLDRVIATAVIAAWTAQIPADAPVPDSLRRARELCRQADRVRAAFATANLRLVLALIKRWGYENGTQLGISDLIQEGNLGLMHAIPRYDPSSGNKFSTYAGWWIRHHIVRARQNLGSDVRQPVNIQDLLQRVNRARTLLETELGRKPTNGEIAYHMARKTLTKRLERVPTQEELAKMADPLIRQITATETNRNFLLRHRESMPIADSVGGEDDEAVSYFQNPDPLPAELVEMKADREALQAAIATLDPQLAVVIRRRYGLDDEEPMKLREVGDIFDVSRERIRQLEVKALEALRNALRKHRRRAA